MLPTTVNLGDLDQALNEKRASLPIGVKIGAPFQIKNGSSNWSAFVCGEGHTDLSAAIDALAHVQKTLPFVDVGDLARRQRERVAQA